MKFLRNGVNLIKRIFRHQRKTSLKGTIVLIDFQNHTRGGHFGFWHYKFASEFASRFNKVVVATRNTELTEALFRKFDSLLSSRISFRQLPSGLRKTFDLNLLRKIDGLKKEENLYALIMWAYDLIDLAPPDVSSSIPWAALSGMSWSRRGHSNRPAVMENQLLNLFERSPMCRAFAEHDQFVVKNCKKAVWLPDLTGVSIPRQTTELANRIHLHKQGHFCVGAIGMLAGYRCVNEILMLAMEHQEIKFVLVGKVMEDTIQDDLKPLLRNGMLPNLAVFPGFITVDEELNAAIQATDALFIDGANYPVHSSVACKAIHFGKCIISPRSNSWTQDFIDEWKVGIVYESRTERMEESWKQWKMNGGESRSRAASSAIREPAKIAACFDKVTRELLR